MSQTITVPTVGTNTGFSAVQTYNYDSLNRLKDATEMLTPHGGSATQSWKQTFTFDRYGNRRFDFTNGNTTLPDPNCAEAICNPTISASNNRLTSSGWQYDAAGNTTADAEGRQFTYDAENKQVEVENGSSQLIGQYYFDGDGKRVKKVVPNGETTVFVYDAGAKLIGEYSTEVQPSQDAKTQYLTNDHLGSPRINTDKNGNVTARHDYHPFGEEIYTSQRTQALGYTADTIRKQFTGYERDEETELDFAKERMYAPYLGRFANCDPVYASKEHPANPQRWNLYIYALGNPLAIVDRDGRKPKKIDVYIAFPDIADYQRKDYLRSVEAAIKKEIRAKDVSITVRGWDQSTPDNIAQSLRSKDRTVIIAAHIAGDTSIPMTENNLRGKPRTGAQALLINGGYITGAGVQAFSEDGKQYVVAERIQADNVVTCSCQIHPDTASEIAGRMQSGSSFLYLDGGDDGETSVGVDVQIAIDAAVILGNGGSIQDVRDRANTLMKNSVGASSNAGDERAIVCDSNGKCKEK